MVLATVNAFQLYSYGQPPMPKPRLFSKKDGCTVRRTVSTTATAWSSNNYPHLAYTAALVSGNMIVARYLLLAVADMTSHWYLLGHSRLLLGHLVRELHDCCSQT